MSYRGRFTRQIGVEWNFTYFTAVSNIGNKIQIRSTNVFMRPAQTREEVLRYKAEQ